MDNESMESLSNSEEEKENFIFNLNNNPTVYLDLRMIDLVKDSK